jgi:S1-C subfamily serine protease
VCRRCQQGLDAKKNKTSLLKGKVFSLDVPFYRTRPAPAWSSSQSKMEFRKTERKPFLAELTLELSYNSRPGEPSMKRRAQVLIPLLLSLSLVFAQEPLPKVQISAFVVDNDLHVRAVPKLTLVVDSSPRNESTQVRIVTNLEGVAELSLPVGKYKVTTPNPIEFQGKKFTWEVEFAVNSTTENKLELSNDNAVIEKSTSPASPNPDNELRSLFKTFRDSVVTVWSEFGHGTGFLVDASGLVLTNQHVVSTSQILSVQFDEKRKFPAVLLAADSEKDVAVLWVNMDLVPDMKSVRLWTEIDPLPQEGEKVFTIGSPLHQQKIITSGIISKVEDRAIISDVNINPGNSGGPLFDQRGIVIGITTFGEPRSSGPGVSGIVRIQQAFVTVKDAREKMASVKKPDLELLPVEPTDHYPIDAIKSAANQEKFDSKPYIFGVGDYDVSVISPILRYRYYASEVKAAKQKEKRNRKSAQAVQGTFQPLENLHGWAEYVGEYEPVLLIEARPRLRETFWSAFGRGMAAGYGYYGGPATMHFKTDFYRMKLFCGKDEVKPITPGKFPIVLDERNALVNITDATFAGLYKYPANAITDKCGQVELHIFSEKEPNNPKIKVLEGKTIHAVTSDFEPYLGSSAVGK